MATTLDSATRHHDLPQSSLADPSHDEEPVKISIINYSTQSVEEQKGVGVEACENQKKGITWISVSGIHQPETIREIGDRFGLHALVLEDILNRGHRTKLEVYPDYLFLILKWPKTENDQSLSMENVAIVIGNNWLIHFHEKGNVFFDEVRNRIRSGRGRIRKMGPDYLGYALIDTLVNYYFPLLEGLEDKVDQLDDDITKGEWNEEILDVISNLKRTALKLWRVLWSMRDLGNQIQRSESHVIEKKSIVFFRDMQDHVLHLVELSEMMRIRLDDLTNLYLGRISMRMNEIMKTLTIIGSIFIPLTFIAGVYGMNFQNMPELSTAYGYPIIWLIMLMVALGLLAVFKQRKWL